MIPTHRKPTPFRIGAGRLACLTAALVLAAGPAAAHPHVWVSTKSVLVFENGALTALRYTWVFDEMYTASATEGLDVNKDGVFDANELAELTKVNAEGLKEFDYFTQARLFGKEIKFADATDVSMEVVEVAEAPGPQLTLGLPSIDEPPRSTVPSAAPPPAAQAQAPAPPPAAAPGLWSRFTSWVGGLFGRSPPATAVARSPVPTTPAPAAAPAEKSKVLALHMTLPLPKPIPASELTAASKAFQFVLGDGQMFIWFEPAKDGVTIAPGAPEQCRIDMVDQELDEQQKKLAEAFGKLGSSPISLTPKAVQVSCAAR